MALILDDESAMEVVLSLLWKSKVGQMVIIPPRGEDLGEEDEESAEEEQGWEVIEVEGRREGQVGVPLPRREVGVGAFLPSFLPPSLTFLLIWFNLSLFCVVLVRGRWGNEDRVAPL